MKALCDICGGSLLIDVGGKSAVCTVCGMQHSIERVREKLGVSAAPANEELNPTPSAEEIPSTNAEAKIDDAEIPYAVFEEIDDTEIPYAVFEEIDDKESPSYYTSDYPEDELAQLEGRIGDYQGTSPFSADELQGVFAQYFSSNLFECYEIEEFVSADTFGANNKCMPINFLFKKDNVPVLAVAIIRSAKAVRHGAVTGTKAALAAQKIKYIGFLAEMPNNEFYVKRKVLKALGF